MFGAITEDTDFGIYVTLRASGKELVRPGEVKVTMSDFFTTESCCVSAPDKDTAYIVTYQETFTKHCQ